MLLEVSDRDYKDFYTDVERNKYCKRLAKDVTIVSLDEMRSENFRDKDVIEDTNVDIEFEIQRKMEIEQLKNALLKLDDNEYKLIRALFFDQKTIREYANTLKIPFTTLEYQKEKILKKLKKFLKF